MFSNNISLAPINKKNIYLGASPAILIDSIIIKKHPHFSRLCLNSAQSLVFFAPSKRYIWMQRHKYQPC